MTPSSPAGRRLRIAVLNRVFSPTGGGAERYSMALVEQLALRHDIHVFAQTIDHHWTNVTYHKVAAPVTRPRWLNQLGYNITTWWATRRGFDVVHSHESTWHGQVQTVHVLPVRHQLFQGRTGWRRALRWCKVVTSPRLLAYLAFEASRFAARPGRHVVATSPALSRILERTYPACAPTLSVIPPGVSLPLDPPSREQARRSLGLPQDGVLIAFVGNDYQKKGLGTLLEALQRLPANVALAVVGNPSYIRRFRDVAQALGVVGRVYFLGSLKDVSPLYSAADILAHPTLEDTFAMVVLEAMAHGVPVVVSDARYCGIAGLLTAGANALILANPTDATGLTTQLNRLLTDVNLYQALAQGARDFAAQWSWPKIAGQQEAMYQEVAALASNRALVSSPSQT